MIYLKKHETQFGTIFALCDEELIGKKFSEGKRELDLEKYSLFYMGEKIEENEAREIIKQGKIYSANVVGKRSVSIFVEAGIVKKESIATIKGIPIVQVFNVSEL
ncbi:MAG: DUF424 domain-containing protein [Candidatus Micrarchaeia archaeon]